MEAITTEPKRNISTQTYELAKVYTLIQNAQIRASVLMREKGVSGAAKNYLKVSIVNRLNAIINDIKYIFRDSPQDLEIMKNELLNDEMAMQVDYIQNMFLDLPKGIRDEVETYIEQRHKIYCCK